MSLLFSRWESYHFKDNLPQLYAHTLVPYNEKILLFSGSTKSLDASPSSFYHTDSASGSIMHQKSTLPPLSFRTCGVFDEIFYLFGGSATNLKSNTVEKYMGVTKKNEFLIESYSVTPKGSIKPCARSHHSCVVYNASMIIFGGVDSSQHVLNDIWFFHICLLTLLFLEFTFLFINSN